MEFQFRTMEVTVPSGFKYTIREQNGEDEDILSNPVDLRDLSNFTKFLMAIVVETNFTASKKLTLEDARNMPLLDKYLLLICSRILSLGSDLQFEHTFAADGSTWLIEQSLDELLLSDYGAPVNEEELLAKPFAVPAYSNYPNGDMSKCKAIPLETSSGKKLTFDLLTVEGERQVLIMPDEQRTRNNELKLRNLKLLVGDNWEKVSNFRMFSAKDMVEIRRQIEAIDPIYTGIIEFSPKDKPHIVETTNIFTVPSFFYFTV